MKEDKLNKLCTKLKTALELKSQKQKFTFCKEFLQDVCSLMLPGFAVTLAKAESDSS